MKNIVGRWKTIWRPPRGHKGAMPWGVRPIKLHITHHISQALSTNCIFVLHILDILHIYNISFIIHSISSQALPTIIPLNNCNCMIITTVVHTRYTSPLFTSGSRRRKYMILQDKGTQKKWENGPKRPILGIFWCFWVTKSVSPQLRPGCKVVFFIIFADYDGWEPEKSRNNAQ